MKINFSVTKFGVFGLGLTGSSVLKYLSQKNCKNIICYDDDHTKRQHFISNIDSYRLLSLDSLEWRHLDFIILSPGIKKTHKIFLHIAIYSIKVISDVDLLYLDNPDKLFIGITGTNGKTTISRMLHHIFKEQNRIFHLCGNIGKPVLDYVFDRNCEGYIIELSSFQLDYLSYLRMDLSCITNISSDHLDYYKSLEHYIKSKLKIFTLTKGKKILFSNTITHNLVKDSNINICPIIVGSTIEDMNITIVSVISSYFNITESVIKESLLTYKATRYAREYMGRYRNMIFYNDSKATNVAATLGFLKSFNNKNIVLLLGGGSKGETYNKLYKHLLFVDLLVVFGSNRYILYSELSRLINVTIVNSLECAINEACKFSEAFGKDINIILSPMSNSFDAFQNFAHRGRVFEEYIKNKYPLLSI